VGLSCRRNCLCESFSWTEAGRKSAISQVGEICGTCDDCVHIVSFSTVYSWLGHVPRISGKNDWTCEIPRTLCSISGIHHVVILHSQREREIPSISKSLGAHSACRDSSACQTKTNPLDEAKIGLLRKTFLVGLILFIDDFHDNRASLK